MKIWTGHTGEAHITAELFRTLLIGIFGMGSYIFQVWEKFEHTLESNNSLLIKRGMMIHHGNVSYVNEKTGDHVTITNGTQGMKRIDLIVNRYKREELSGKESNEWVHIPGTPDASDPKPPAYNNGNVMEGALIDDCPVFQIELDGLNITKVTNLLPVHAGYQEKIRGGWQTPIKGGTSAPTGGKDGDVYIQFEN